MIDSKWTSFPILVAFHDQWWAARGSDLGQSKLPFSRDWESLLSDAGLTSAELRREAEREIRVLAKSGLLRIKSPPRRPTLIMRIALPVENEFEFAALFGDVPPDLSDRFDPTTVDWAPELMFLSETRCGVNGNDLIAINTFFQKGGRNLPMVPIKERSLVLFGDEKRLDALATTSLFGPGRLSLDQLRTFVVPEPLPWRRGPGPAGTVLVLENVATWHSFSIWNASSARYAAVVYGGGHRFVDGILSLVELTAEIGAIQQIDYFGDLDFEGLRIPQLAATRAEALKLPAPRPFEWAYKILIAVGKPTAAVRAGDPGIFLEWLPISLRPTVHNLFAANQRIAQEWLGHETLRGFPPA